MENQNYLYSTKVKESNSIFTIPTDKGHREQSKQEFQIIAGKDVQYAVWKVEEI